MSTKIAYTQANVPAGYGPRVFLTYQTLENSAEVVKELNRLSMWGGSDKDTGKAKSWEFPSYSNVNWNRALMFLNAQGFQIVEGTAANANEFWGR